MTDVPVEYAFAHCPRCGRQNDSPGSVPFRCPDCAYADFFGPVAAVGALVTNDAGELLLVRRAREPGKGRWGLPGGFVDRYETAEDAVAREVHEETELRVTRSDFLMTYPNRYTYRGVVVPVIDLFFRCQVAPGEIHLADGELDHYEWLHPGPEQLSQMAFKSNRVAIERWLKSEA